MDNIRWLIAYSCIRIAMSSIEAGESFLREGSCWLIWTAALPFMITGCGLACFGRWVAGAQMNYPSRAALISKWFEK